jgi:hypothetical protein
VFDFIANSFALVGISHFGQYIIICKEKYHAQNIIFYKL